MDQTSPSVDPLPRGTADPAPLHSQKLRLALVNARFRLAKPADAPPAGWDEGLAALLDWLGIAAELVPAARMRRLARLADLAVAPANDAPVFAPWLGWSPVAFQHGGAAHLPQAQFVASYLLEHPRSAAPGLGGLDVMLMSPHPMRCTADATGDVPVPRAGLMRAMVQAARAQRRERLAIILHARQRNAVAAQLLAAGKGLTGDGMTLDILTIEDALAPFMAPRVPWDAVIAMPDLRGTVFTLLGHGSGMGRAWPMQWFTGERGQTLALVTSEAAGEGVRRLPLDACALIHTLTLALHAAGAERAAARLHEGWALLRDSGVTTAGHGGTGAAPYSNAVTDSVFLTMLCRGDAVSKRAQQPWRALGLEKNAASGSQIPRLRVVS